MRAKLLTLNQWQIKLSAFPMTEQVFKRRNLCKKLWKNVQSSARLYLRIVKLMICLTVDIFTTVFIAKNTGIRVFARKVSGRKLSVIANLPKKQAANIMCAIFQQKKVLILSARLKRAV